MIITFSRNLYILKKYHITSVFIFLFLGFSFGQKPGGLSGDYYVGISQTYTSIGLAIDALNSNGVSGNVNFILTDETYAETPRQITKGGSSGKVVTFKPNTGITPEITVNATGKTYWIQFLGVSYINFDGSNTVGGTSVDTKVTINNADAAVFLLTNSTGAKNKATTYSTYITIKNIEMIGRTNSSTTSIGIKILGTGQDNNTIQNNKIKKQYYGIYITGSNSNTNNNTIITDNVIGSSVASEYIYTGGIYCEYVTITNLSITNNEIFNIIRNSGSGLWGIWMYEADDNITNNITISKNKIHDIIYTGTGAYGGKGILINLNSSSPNIIIKNNFIWSMSGDGDGSFVSPQPMGIDLLGNATSNVYIYYNSIYLTQNTSNGLNTNNTFAAALSVRGSTGVTVKNNILSCNLGEKTGSSATTKGYGVFCTNTGATNPFASISNNIYYITNQDNNYLGFISTGGMSGTNYSNLTSWGTFSGETNSYVENPNYTSTSNLHITTTNDKGTPIGSITDDIDNESRNASTPDVGADETNVTLPIELLSFYGSCDNNIHKLSWHTFSETNNDHFIIESSIDGYGWDLIAIVEGAGNSNTPLNYSYTDENISAEKTYYRLKQVDYNGAFEYYGPIVVSCNSYSLEILSLYPNPASTSFDFAMNSEHDNVINVRMLNILGEEVYNKTFSVRQGINILTVSTENLAKNVYYFSVESTDGTFTDKRQVLIK